MNIIDRRLNPSGKSLANRQRFLRRAREHVVKAVREASAKRAIQDIEAGDSVTIPTDGIHEPSFRRAAGGGRRDQVFPGNKDFVEGNTIPRPPKSRSRQESQGSPDGDGEDSFQFMLTREEFLDIFLDDLELPDLIKRKIKETHAVTLTRAGFSVNGSPNTLNLARTMRNSLSRRIALRRPKPEDVATLEREQAALEAEGGSPEAIQALAEQAEHLRRRARRIPYIDPMDVRYNRFEAVPKPVAQAVMFCLMDVSGSMTEHMKDLAKRFYFLLYLFLKQRYKAVDIVFIRHTHEAKEVDEETFFYSAETGGTVVSTALVEMLKVIKGRYPTDDWNIYAAQASDGDNLISDNDNVTNILRNELLPSCQYFSYIEVAAESHTGTGFFERDTELWRTYRAIAEDNKNLSMRRVRTRRDIVPVFRELFARNPAHS